MREPRKEIDPRIPSNASSRLVIGLFALVHWAILSGGAGQGVDEVDLRLEECRTGLAQVERNLASCSGDVVILEERLQSCRSQLATAMSVFYRIRDITLGSVLLSDEPMATHLRRKTYMAIVAGSLSDQHSERRGRDPKSAEHSTRLNALVDRQRRLEVTLSSKKEALRGIGEKREALIEGTRSELAERQRLSEGVHALGTPPGGPVQGMKRAPFVTEGQTPFSQLKGQLPWPVDGPVVRSFGGIIHPELKTRILHKGWCISAMKGDSVRVVATGRVLFADWVKGYGRLVIVDHGEGYCTLYAHNDEILAPVGTVVASQQALATVGDIGSLEGPRLYFEIRRDNVPVNPEEWLVARAKPK